MSALGWRWPRAQPWAAYIIFSSRTGARFAQLDGLAIAMTIAAFLVAPVGLVTGGSALWTPDALWRGATIALMSSVLPYSLELIALRRLAAHVFGILLSVEPAVAALAGLLVLGQHLGVVQLIGMACVVAASALVLGSKSAPSHRQLWPRPPTNELDPPARSGSHKPERQLSLMARLSLRLFSRLAMVVTVRITTITAKD